MIALELLLFFLITGLLLFKKMHQHTNRANSDGGSVKEAVGNNLAITRT